MRSAAFQRVTQSPLLIRVVPFVIFLILTTLQGKFGESSKYWLYLAKTLVGLWLIWLMRPYVLEMRWKISWEGVAVGFGVFGLWIGLDGLYPRFGGSGGGSWNPHEMFGLNTALAWTFIAVRIAGSAFVVPPLEEVFYRSFVYRYLIRPEFENEPLGRFDLKAFLITAIIFGVVHPNDWLAGILCGLAYQGLVVWKQRLGDAMTAHAVTNFLLGIWVVWKGAWQFW
jgi:uncharacterized protein